MIPILQSRYKFDYVTVKQYGTQIKLTYHKTPVRSSGFELPQTPKQPNTNNPNKLEQSLSRTRSTVKELALCNDWQYFITLTLDAEKYDRYNLNTFRKDLSQYIRNFNRLSSANVKYLLIPEQHKDGAWHMHGLISGLPATALTTNKNGYLDWQGYSSRFGFCSLDTIKSKEKVSNYITKYISKDLAQRAKELNAHLYYASKGLNRAITLYEGHLLNVYDMQDSWHFSNEYVSIRWGKPADFADCTFDDDYELTLLGK